MLSSCFSFLQPGLQQSSLEEFSSHRQSRDLLLQEKHVGITNHPAIFPDLGPLNTRTFTPTSAAFPQSLKLQICFLNEFSLPVAVFIDFSQNSVLFLPSLVGQTTLHTYTRVLLASCVTTVPKSLSCQFFVRAVVNAISHMIGWAARYETGCQTPPTSWAREYT